MSESKVTPVVPFASDGSFFEQFQRMQGAQKAAQAQASQEAPASHRSGSVDREPAASVPPTADDQEFIASTSFTGLRPGYLFKSDDSGLGYYKDVGLEGWAQRRQEQAKAKPKAIKANKGIGKVPARGGAAAEPPAKKSKTDAADDKPKYLREMEKYKSLSCSGDTKHDRPLVK